MNISLENKEKIVALIKQGICPVCNKSFLVVLRHISRSHGIPARDLKDILLLSRRSSFISAEQSEKYRQIAVINNLGANLVPGRKVEAEPLTREKVKEKMFSHYKSDTEHRNIIREKAKKAVMRISSNKIVKEYDSIESAAKDVKLNRSTISRYIRYKRLDKQGGSWIYKRSESDE